MESHTNSPKETERAQTEKTVDVPGVLPGKRNCNQHIK